VTGPTNVPGRRPAAASTIRSRGQSAHPTGDTSITRSTCRTSH
jgi:hypothetical protein